MEIVLFCTGTVMKLLVCYESRNLLRLSRLRSQIIWFKSPHYGTVFNNNLLSKFSSNVTCQSICFDIQSNRRKWLQTTIIIVIYNPLSNLTWVKRSTHFSGYDFSGLPDIVDRLYLQSMARDTDGMEPGNVWTALTLTALL